MWGVSETLSGYVSSITQLKPAPGRWRVALRVTAGCALAVVVVALVWEPGIAAMGIMGAMVAVTAGGRPWRARVPILTVMVTAYIVACSLGTVLGAHPIGLTVMFTLLAGGAGLVYHALLPDPPGPIFVLIGPAIASYLSTVGVPKATIVGVCALSAVVASIAGLVLQSVSSVRAEEEAVTAAQDQVGALVAATSQAPKDSPQIAALRDQAYASVFSASLVLEESVGRHPHSKRHRRLTKRLRRLHRSVVTVIAGAEFPGANLAISSLEQRRYLGSPGSRYLLRWGLSRRSFPWFAARRLSLAILLTCVTTYSLGLTHPYWGVMTTALVMSMGTDRMALTTRAIHRMIGTVGGLVVFLVIHGIGVRGIDLLIVALGLVYLIQLTAVRNYALAVVFITPMALLISTAAHPPADIWAVLGDRLIDTLVGVVCSLVIMWVTGYRTPVALIRRQFRRTLRATERVLALLALGTQSTAAGFQARRDLAYEEMQTARILRISQQELPRQLAAWSALDPIVNRLCYTVLSACWLEHPRRYLDAARMSAQLHDALDQLPPIDTTNIDVHQLVDQLQQVRAAGVPRAGTG